MINSYPSIYALGHGAVADLLNHPVIVEEKIDGSQFSFWKNSEGFVECRSKGAIVNTIAPEGMFKHAVEAVMSIEHLLPWGVTWRGEYLAKPKHNILNYNRIPRNHIMIFDVNTSQETYVCRAQKEEMAKSIGMECVPILFEGRINSPDEIRAFLESESCLGGHKVEGVVIKPIGYHLFGADKKALMAKFVSEAFKEVHASDWKKDHGPKSSNDILIELARQFATPARWQKALIHLREEGAITDSPRDIEALIAAVPPDVLKECQDEIKEALFAWAWPNLKRAVTRGLPEWYKDTLLKKQFE